MPVTNQLEIDIKAKSDKATASLDKLISKLNEVNTALNSLNVNNIQNIANSLKGMKGIKVNVNSSTSLVKTNDQFARANSLMQTLTATSNKANASMFNLNKTVFKLAATWGMFYASAYPFIRALNAAWKSTQSAMDYVETYNYYSVTMDKIFSQVGEDAADAFQNSYVSSLKSISEKMTGFTVGVNGELFENYSKNLGADPEALMNYQARIGAVTNAVGLLAEQSLDAQKALSMLSQDLSSLTNTPLESVMTNLQSGLIGQSRALYKYGIDITNATLKEYALANGVTKSVSAMSQAEKMQLRLVAILDQSKVAWGDMANTVNSVSNQYRIFSQNISNLSRVLGNLFLPIVAQVLPYINALMISLRQMFTLLGFKIYGDNWLKDALDGISSGYSGDDIVEGLEDIESAAEDATGASKKLKQAVMGFDELNIINPNTSNGGSGSGGGAGVDLTSAIETALGDYESIWNKAFADAENKAANLANKIMSYIKSGNFEGLGKWISTSLKDQLDSIDWDNIYEGARNFGTGLAQFMNGLIRPSTFYAVGKTVANSLNTAIYTALAFGQEFDYANLGKSIAAYWNGIFENFDFKSFGRTIGLWVGGITKTIATAIKKIKWDKLFNGVKDSINGFFKGFFESGVNIGDIAIVLGALVIKKVLQFQWAATAIQAISQSLAKALATRIGVDIAADATVATALTKGFAAHMSVLGANLSRLIGGSISTNAIADSLVGVETFGAKATAIFGTAGAAVLGFGSIIGGVALTVHEFFDMFENGADGVSIALAVAGAAITAFGIAVTGPIGVVVAAFTGLLGVAIECGLRLKELNEIHNEELFNEIIAGTEGGTHSLQDFVDHMNSTVDTVTTGLDSVNTKFDELENSRNQIKKTTDEIGTIAFAMQSGRELTESQIEELGKAFDTLKEQLKSAISASYDYLIAETMADYQYLEATGQVTDEISKKYQDRIMSLSELKQATIDNASEMADAVAKEQENYRKVKAAYDEGKASAEELQAAQDNLWQALTNYSSYASNYTDSMSDIDKATKDATDSLTSFEGSLNLTDLDLENWDDLKTEVNGTIDSITTAYNEGVELIKGTNDTFEEEMQRAVRAHEMTEEEAESAIEEHKNTVEQRLQDLRTVYQTELDALNNDLLKTMPTIIQTASDKWNELSEAEKALYSYDKERYIKEKFRDYANEVINGEDGLSKSLDKAYADANLIQDSTLEKTSSELADKIFSTQHFAFTNGQFDVSIAGDFEEIINKALRKIDVSGEAENTAKKVGKKYAEFTQDGFNKQIDTGMPNSDAVLNRWMNRVDTSIHDSILDFGSPSKRMGTYALWTIQGYNNGIDDNKKLSEIAMANLGIAIVKSFDNSLANVKTSIDTWYKNSVEPFFTTDKWITLSQGMEEGLSKRWSDFSSWWKNTGFADWWNDEVTPWFKVETWTPFGDNFKTALSTKWTEFSDWWTNTGFSDWWKNNVTPWFEKATWLPFGENAKSALTDKWNAFTSWWAATGITDWWTKSVEPYFTKDKWTFNGIKDGLKQAFDNAIEAVKQIWNSFADYWNDKLTWTLPSIDLPNGTTVGGNTVSLGSIPKFALGGFPEDGLFMANHNELVGQFSNGQTAVANNEQIVEGIRSGVASAVREELGYYLRDIADNTSATATNTEDIKNKPNQTLSNRDIARANRVGSRSMGLTLRTT